MDKTVWRFELTHEPFQEIELPFGAEILMVKPQWETFSIWALVDPAAEEKELRFFEVFSTGQIMPHEENIIRKYVGTYRLHSGSAMSHVFENIELK